MFSFHAEKYKHLVENNTTLTNWLHLERQSSFMFCYFFRVKEVEVLHFSSMRKREKMGNSVLPLIVVLKYYQRKTATEGYFFEVILEFIGSVKETNCGPCDTGNSEWCISVSFSVILGSEFQ